MGDAFITRRGGASDKKGFPVFTYTGAYSLIDDEDGNWRIKFLSSGTLNFTEFGTGNGSIDVFCVGGGGGSGNYWNTNGNYNSTGCGGAGYTKTQQMVCLLNTDYAVVIGEGGLYKSSIGGSQAGTPGGSSSFDAISANGGDPGTGNRGNSTGGKGGSGGAGSTSVTSGAVGTGGVDGGNGTSNGGSGQGTTTKEFAEVNGELYASGGGSNLISLYANTGNGGIAKGNGASGIVVIRNHRS